MDSFLALRILLVLALISLVGCGKNGTIGSTTSHRQAQRDQNEADTNAEMNDLQPAEGEYSGVMEMVKSHQSFRLQLSIRRVYENARSSQLLDPTQTVNLPKLSGFLKFPVLDRMNISDYGHYKELIDPMGGFSTILFNLGDYDPKTHLLILPYNVSGYTQGNFGELQGQLENGVFTGTWFAQPLGVVGNFSLRQKKTSSVNP